MLALSAAAIFPIVGLIGAGLDMSRMYAVKSRLQSACDAGALTGRRVMGANTWSYNNGIANTQALKAFDLNFGANTFGTSGLTRSYTETSGSVGGQASVTVPLTLMKIPYLLMGQPSSTIGNVSVTCDSQMRIPNTDVMFVLDTTGSMYCTPAMTTAQCGNYINYYGYQDQAGSRIQGLKHATKCFYEALAKLNSQENCGPDPTGGLSSSIQLRFGFVPYASNVNVAASLPTSYFANQWSYQSRQVPNQLQWVSTGGAWTTTSSTTGTPGSYSWNNSFQNVGANVTVNGTTYNQYLKKVTSCNGANTPPNTTAVTNTSTNTVLNPGTLSNPSQTSQTSHTDTTNDNVATRYRYANWTASSTNGWAPGYCTLQKDNSSTYQTTSSSEKQRSISWAQQLVATSTNFDYKKYTFDISGLKNGSSWDYTVDVPVNLSSPMTDANGNTYRIASTKTATWDGCIEEAQTFQNTDGNPADDWSPIPASAKDMNIDLVPNPSDPTTLWGPALPDIVWGRVSNGNYTRATVSTNNDLSGYYSYYCPQTPASKLTAYTTGSTASVRNGFDTYVDSLVPAGSTYHDIGMLWGARFISPDGIFASENRLTPGGGQINRNIIFMTDGDTSTHDNDYTAYGINWWDQRQTNAANPADDANWVNATFDGIVNARLIALCTAVKNKNITIWVISFGAGVMQSTKDRLKSCATDDAHYFDASDNIQLNNAFNSIATKIGQLRLTS